MGFKIKAGKALFEWKNSRLYCSDSKELELFKNELSIHKPKVVAQPDLIDYDWHDELNNGCYQTKSILNC